MQILTDIRQPQPGDTFRQNGPLHLTIGNFDGVHRGHQALLRQLVASTHGRPAARSALLTFDPHPLAVLRPALPLHLLTTPQERLDLAAALGIDVGIRQAFTREVAALSAREFVTLLVENVGLSHLVVGPDFALGRGRGGTLDVLRALGDELGYTVEVIEAIEWSGAPARSSEIRRCLEVGNVEQAAALLGRRYSVCGPVQQGDQRGRTLGVPTANVAAPPPKLLPANGVYATWSQLLDEHNQPAGARYASVTNIGTRPTVDGKEQRVEAHLLDFPTAGETADLYDKILCIDFVQRLRNEQRFDNLDALVSQIRLDIEQARVVLEAVVDGAVLAESVRP